MKTLALPVVLLLAASVFGQTPHHGCCRESSTVPAFTTDVSFPCNQEGCNGIPLAQGGTWQFIEANAAFSLYSTGIGMFGNPGNPSTYNPPCTYTAGSCANSTPGGLSNVVDTIPEPPFRNGAVGASGTITFNYQAVTCNQPCSQTTYFGHVKVTGHEVKHCNQHGCWDQMIVDIADIYIDSIQ